MNAPGTITKSMREPDRPKVVHALTSTARPLHQPAKASRE